MAFLDTILFIYPTEYQFNLFKESESNYDCEWNQAL